MKLFFTIFGAILAAQFVWLVVTLILTAAR